MKTSFFVYILTNENKTVLYIGVTNNLQERVLEHYHSTNPKSFSRKYKAHYLLYYEEHAYVFDALSRERELKGWRRQKKMHLINSFNPDWGFLNKEVFGMWPPIGFGSRLDK